LHLRHAAPTWATSASEQKERRERIHFNGNQLISRRHLLWTRCRKECNGGLGEQKQNPHYTRGQEQEKEQALVKADVTVGRVPVEPGGENVLEIWTTLKRTGSSRTDEFSYALAIGWEERQSGSEERSFWTKKKPRRASCGELEDRQRVRKNKGSGGDGGRKRRRSIREGQEVDLWECDQESWWSN